MEKQLFVDDRKESYGSFFTDDFAHVAFAIADKTPILSQPVFDLVADWRGASYAAALPAQLPQGIKDFHDSFTEGDVEPSGILRFADAILTKLSRQLPDLAHDPTLSRSIHATVVQIASELTEAKAVASQVKLDGEEIWRHYLQLHPFSMGLHSTMRLAYLSVYNAYENFVVRLVSIAHDGKRIRVTSKDFAKDFRAKFGDIVEGAWFQAEIRSARLVRHALAHAGGRVTDDLRDSGLEIPVVVHNSELSVTPDNIKSLYKVLSPAAKQLMTAPCFSC